MLPIRAKEFQLIRRRAAQAAAPPTSVMNSRRL
jgi:hypothetical protein